MGMMMAGQSSPATNPQMPPMGGQMPQMGGQMPMQPPEEIPTPEDDSSEIDRLLSDTNIADKLNKTEKGKNKLNTIGSDVWEGYTKDKESRKDWEAQNEVYIKLACQFVEKKNFPWPNASNVKYPVLTTAALQFASRAYPSLIGGFDIVKAKAIGNDPSGEAAKAAQDISTHMSYQLLHEMQGWDEDMDKLCFILPILGTCFKKTYYSKEKECNVSELVLPKDLIVNYWAKDIDSAFRKTHVLYRTPNQIKERQLEGIYLDDIDLSTGGSPDNNKKELLSNAAPPAVDESSPRMILEQHTFLDLDEDDYKEPYTIIVDYETRKVLRIVARFYKEGVKLNEKGDVVRIVPCEHFTKFGFIPNPDGGFYDLGFGILLGGVNESVNTLINQLIDAGTLSIVKGGFITKGIRIKQGELKMRPGQWQMVNNFGDDLKKGIYPLPVKEPSNVLFQLLGTLIQSGKELASIAEIFTGKMPGQNTPAATTMATIEQGLKVFTAIYKRIFRSLGEEFEKLYKLNKIYLPDQVTFTVDVAGASQQKTVKKENYSYGTQPTGNKAFVKIIPAADPNMVSETQKLMKAQGLLELMPMGTINPKEATLRILENEGHTDVAKLTEMPPAGPPPDVAQKQAQLEWDKEYGKRELDLREKEIQIKGIEVLHASMERQAKAKKALAEAEAAGNETNLVSLEAEYKKMELEETSLREFAKMQMDHQLNRENASADRAVDLQKHSMGLDVKKEIAAMQPKGGNVV